MPPRRQASYQITSQIYESSVDSPTSEISMQSNTSPKTERRVLTIFWSILFMVGVLAVCRVHSIHVTSVRRKKEEDGSVVFSVEVINPTDQSVNAKILLSTNSCSGNGEATWYICYTRQAKIAANTTSIVEFRFNPLEAKLVAGADFASVVKTVPIQKVTPSNREPCICL